MITVPPKLKPLRSSAPPGSILNPAFHYTPSQHTNVAETFRRCVTARKTLDAETEVRR